MIIPNEEHDYLYFEKQAWIRYHEAILESLFARYPDRHL